MGKWRWLREIMLIVAPMILGAAFLFFDLLGIAQLNPGGRNLNWPYLALIAFGAVIVVALYDIGRLVCRVLQLERAEAELSILYRPGEHPYFWPPWGHRIGVYNHGPALADGVEVMLKDIIPQPASFPVNVLPSPLGHKDGFCQRNKCVLNKDAEHYFDVLSDFYAPQELKGKVWRLQTKANPIADVKFHNDRDHYLQLELTAGNLAAKVTRYLRIRQKDSGGLDVTLVEQVPDTAVSRPQSVP